MRVLRISHSAVVRSWRQREQSIRERGVDVRLIAARRWNEAGRVLDLSPLPGEPVTPVRTFGTHPALFLYDPIALWRALRSEIDVLDIHEEPFALATAQILLLRKVARQRAPYTLYSAQNFEKRYPPPFRWLERVALRHAAGLQVCNDAAGEICARKGFPGRPVTIGLGVEPAVFNPGGVSRSRSGTNVGYAGRLERRKGIFVLLDAVAAGPELTLSVAGAGSAEDELRSEIVARGLSGRVHLAGALHSDDLADFYRRLDVLAVPSLTTGSWVEQFGRVAVEAMACGTPVVSSDSGALPDVVADAGLVVPEGDATALLSALREAAGSGGETFSTAGRDRARQFHWSAIAGRFVDLYRTVTHAPLPALRPINIIVVAYGAPDDLERCLAPLRSDRILVVDNSSRADVESVCTAAGVRYVDAGRNGGFGAGVNIGLAQLSDPTADVLLLNPDAIITDDDIDRLQDRLLAEPDLASVGPAQVDGAGRPARVGWPLPSPLRVWREALGLDLFHQPPDEYAIGSVLLLRAEALAQVGGFDERFFLYAEETDWAKRAVQLGWRHTVVPEVRATHVGAATSTDSTLRDAHFHAAQETFHRKHFGAFGWTLARAAIVSGAALRSVILRGDRGAAAHSRMMRYVHGPSVVRDQHVRATRSPERIE